MAERRKRSIAGDKTICLPIGADVDYDKLVEDTKAFRAYLDNLIVTHPELFPIGIEEGYSFHGFVESGKLQLSTRRIRLKRNGQAYQLRPDTVMPYMIGKTEEVEKGLYLRRYGVPYEGIAHVLGHSAMYWYHATQALGRVSIVGSTVKDPDAIPPHLAVDEKHTWWWGERIYVTVTAAIGCFLGVGVAQSADAQALIPAYGEFRHEALELNPNYAPQSVNTDGWDATQNAWKALFPGITLMLCFLHSVLGIQKVCRRTAELFQTVSQKLWRLYHSLNPRQFAQRLRRLIEWANNPQNNLPEPLRQKVLGLNATAAQFRLTFELPDAYRTSNQVDRLINYQDRILYGMQYFHGTLDAAKQALRAMAIIWNFHPYCRKVQAMEPHSMSPFEDLNGFRYHDNWLRNLLIASSLNGRGTGKPVKHKLE